jgi:MFS family permease
MQLSQSVAPHDPYAALRLPDYRRLMLACVATSFGNEIQAVAVGWELYERTHSAAVLSLIGLVLIIPVYLLALPAGHAADRHSRIHIFVIAQVLLCFATLGLAAFSATNGPLWIAYLSLGLSGVAQAFLRPARWALVPQVVPRDLLQSAITWNSTSWQFAAVAGPAAGGYLIYQTGGAVAAYLANAILTGIAAALVLQIRSKPAAITAEPMSMRSYLAGFRFVFSSELILATITLDLFAVLLGGAQAILPIFAKDILHVGADGLGWLRAAESLGAMGMALVLAHRPPLRRAGPSLMIAVAIFGFSMIGFGLSTSFLLSFFFLALAGAVDNISIVVRSTLVQILTPDSMRGRVSAVNSLFIGTSNELGGFESGVTAAIFGPVLSVVGGGIGTLLVVAAVALKWPSLLKLREMRHPTAEESADLEPVAESPAIR